MRTGIRLDPERLTSNSIGRRILSAQSGQPSRVEDRKVAINRHPRAAELYARQLLEPHQPGKVSRRGRLRSRRRDPRRRDLRTRLRKTPRRASVRLPSHCSGRASTSSTPTSPRARPRRSTTCLRSTPRISLRCARSASCRKRADWMYSSFETVPTVNNFDREYFQYHRLHPEDRARVSAIRCYPGSREG